MKYRRIWQCFSLQCIIVILVLLLTALQLLHVMLLSHLRTNENHQNNARMKSREHLILQYHAAMKDIVVQNVKVDSSGQYHVVQNLYTDVSDTADSDILESSVDITLISHCSLNNVHYIADLHTAWQGCLSVTLFCTNHECVSATILGMSRLLHCMPSLRNNISYHLVYPFSHLNAKMTISSDNFSCTSISSLFKSSDTKTDSYSLGNVKYPNNLLRNVGINAAKTTHVIVVDIDILPSMNLREHFKQFQHKQINLGDESYTKTVYVLPAFEIMSSRTQVPHTKSTLVELVKRGFARSFYEDVCQKCQYNTDYKRWNNLPIPSSLEVGFEVMWKDPWEPFYIGPKDLPLYDERFKQYGFNRISQVRTVFSLYLNLLIMLTLHFIQHCKLILRVSLFNYGRPTRGDGAFELDKLYFTSYLQNFFHTA